MTVLETMPNACELQSSAPLKIALLGYRSAPHVGGQGIYLKYLSESLVNLGHRVDVISGPPYPELDPRVKLIKLPSLDLFAAKSHPILELRPKHLLSFTDFYEWWSMATGGFAEPYTFSRRVVKYLESRVSDYDIVHDNQCLGYGLLTIQARGLPTVATVHHPISRDRQLALDAAPNWWHRLLVRRWHSFLGMQGKVVRNLKHIITVSEQSRRDIAEAFYRPVEKIDLIHNGIDTRTFCPQPHIARKPYRLMTTASADQPLKGLKYLLEAIGSLQKRYPDITLLVVGKLKRGGQTEKQLRQLGIENRVTFVSGISTERMVEYYAETELAVSPSLYEGFGLPVGEAMACGVPVVACDGGALPEVVGDAGLVVKAADSGALAAAIRQLLDSQELRDQLATRGRKRILKLFSWNVAARQMTRFYHQVLERENH